MLNLKGDKKMNKLLTIFITLFLFITLVVGISHLASAQKESENTSISDTVHQEQVEIDEKSKSFTVDEANKAIDKFVSEYEIYCQDISSGNLDLNNLGVSNARVYNALGGACTKDDIQKIESDSYDITGFALNKKTKYPANAETVKTILNIYLKNGFATLTIQDGYCFWYAPQCGTIVYDKTTVTKEELNEKINDGIDDLTIWMKLV